MRRLSLVFATSLAGLLGVACAQADGWSGKGEAGLVIASGNTDTETANAKLALARESGNWKNAFGLAGLYASDSTGTTAQRWEALTQTDYSFSQKNFWFGAARYERDKFSGFVYQAIVSSGLGHKFINNDTTHLIGTAGVGYKFFETRDAFDKDTGVLLERGDTDSQAVFRGTIDFDHQLTETTSIIDKFMVEAGSDNTFVQNDLALQVRMTQVLALALGYSVRHNTDPPIGFKKTDTLTTVNLVYELK